MNCLITFTIFFSWAYGGALQNNLQEDLLTFFTVWLKGDVQNVTLPLPPVDVITIPKFEGTYKELGIKLSYSTSEMKLTGLPSSYLDELNATQSETSLTARGSLVAPSLMLTAEKYKLDGRAYYFYPLKGAGEMRINFQNAVLLFDIALGTNGKIMWVEKLQFGVNVDKIKIDLTGTTNTLTNNLNSKASSMFAEYRADMESAMREAALPVINSFLANKSPEQLLADIVKPPQLKSSLKD